MICKIDINTQIRLQFSHVHTSAPDPRLGNLSVSQPSSTGAEPPKAIFVFRLLPSLKVCVSLIDKYAYRATLCVQKADRIVRVAPDLSGSAEIDAPHVFVEAHAEVLFVQAAVVGKRV